MSKCDIFSKCTAFRTTCLIAPTSVFISARASSASAEDGFLLSDLLLHDRDCVAGLHIYRDGLACEGLHEDLHGHGDCWETTKSKGWNRARWPGAKGLCQ